MQYLFLTLLCCIAATAHRMNVLFLAVDDLRVQLGVDHVPGTPNMSTPNIDALVAKSLFLRKAQVQQAVCSPTRTSILTSRYPDTTRVWDLYSYWRKVGGNYTTIPELFKNNGYHTVGNGKSTEFTFSFSFSFSFSLFHFLFPSYFHVYFHFHLLLLNALTLLLCCSVFHPGHASGAHQQPPIHGMSSKGDDQPYSWSEEFFHAPNLNFWSGKIKQPGCQGCGNSWIAVSPEAEKNHPLPGQQIADNAISQLEQFVEHGIGKAQNEKNDDITNPFFLAVGFHKPHLPFVAPERFYQSYPMDEIQLPGDQNPPQDMPSVAWSSWGELRAYLDIAALDNSGNPGDHLPANVTKALRRAYYASVSWTDYNIGRIVKSLENNGYLNNTVISFWGDHGWQLGEHGEWCKHTNFDLATNAPMFVQIPGKTDQGIVTNTPTEYVDLLPTLVAAAMPDVKVPACPTDAAEARNVQLCTHGVSLLPLINNPKQSLKPAAYSQYPRGYVKPGDENKAMQELESLSPSPLSKANPSECLSKHCTMGYSMLTFHEQTEYRYTEWVDFNTINSNAPNWNRVVGKELYNHNNDPLENINIAGSASGSLLSTLSSLLHRHPVSGEYIITR